MLGIGIGEMILIAGIALVIFGPEKFPDFAKIVLRTVRDLRGYVDDIQGEISKEIKPVKRELEQLGRYDPEKYIDALTKSSAPSPTPMSSKSQYSQPPAATRDKDANGHTDDSYDDAGADDQTRSEPRSSSPEAGQENGETDSGRQDERDQRQDSGFEAPGAAPEKLS